MTDSRSVVQIAMNVQPEQCSGNRLSGRQANLYFFVSLGGLIESLLTRNRPFSSGDAIGRLVLLSILLGERQRLNRLIDVLRIGDKDLIPNRHLVDNPDDADDGDP